ncbi:HEAT repeat domain-containing protein [Candidatus Roseilinea sp. NK_OTU-006]|jgi:HEAT repeat protein|uniref:HEAT repeat domain-containing protein n=1 Tax=Candidatus Roseilinea sp. NK_OTU-006 TaxID=2704250 RepID=UPI00145EFEE2|nr:HEAT repeat domain-containing protein [Candidatus Roseilinea sp. NK_OTU-006]
MTKKTSGSKVTFERAIEALRAETEPSQESLLAFSDLAGERLARWQSVWVTLPSDRRASLTEQLRELAEEDIEADFRPIFRFGLSDPDERVRLASVEGLFEDDHPSLIPLLITALRDDPSPTVRAAAAESLGRFVYFGEMDRLSEARRRQVYAALMHALLTSPEDSPVRRRALESLAYVPNEEVDLHIREAYHSENDLLRLSAIVAMGRSGNRAYCEIVRSELHSVSPAVRRRAAEASGELEDEDAVSDLAQLLDDPDDEVRFAALDALALIGGNEAQKLLRAAADSDDDALAEYAEQALEEFEFWHGEMDFPMALFEEEDLKPKPIRRQGK